MPPITHSENTIILKEMNKPEQVSYFLECIKNSIESGVKYFVINMTEVKSPFPNVCVPIAGLIQYYEKQGITFELQMATPYLQKTQLAAPIAIKNATATQLATPLDKVWRFDNEDDAHSIAVAIVKALRSSKPFAEGVSVGLDWCLGEVMSNVLVHAEVTHGYIMAVLHAKKQRIAVSIYDTGIGIYNSLKTSSHAPQNALQAIRLAMQEGVTRDKTKGQGNGLWGLSQMIRLNTGTLAITSDSVSLRISPTDEQHYESIPIISPEQGATLVDFQIEYNNALSVEDALARDGHSFKPFNRFIENLDEINGAVVVKIAAYPTGTRPAGKRLRNEVLNIFNDTKRPIILDFEGVEIVGSSFADELVAQLVIHFGFFGFNQVIRLSNMVSRVQAIVERSVSQRMQTG